MKYSVTAVYVCDFTSEMFALIKKNLFDLLVYVYAFSRRFYPKRLTNEDITSYKR